MGKTWSLDAESTLTSGDSGNKNNSRPPPLVEETLFKLINFWTHSLKVFNTKKRPNKTKIEDPTTEDVFFFAKVIKKKNDLALAKI